MSKRNREKRAARAAQAAAASAPARASRVWRIVALPLAVVAALGAVAAFVALRGGSDEAAAAGLPNTPDYHALLVAATDPEALMLGTHDGLYRSRDGGRTWTKAALRGQDAMNLSPAGAGTTWVAGHNVLARSTDGGETFRDVRPKGLPSLDVHGFAVDPSAPAKLYAAVAGEGLYRSSDGGTAFELVSREVGPATFGLAATQDGRLLAAEPRRGLFASDDAGRTWRAVLYAAALGVAVNPNDSPRVLATGQGIYLSSDGGRTWRTVREMSGGAGPVAWAPSDRQRAYVVGFDRTLYRSDDGGATWRSVSGG